MIICVFFFLLTLALGRQWQPTPVLLPGKSHGQRSLVGCSPGGREESDMTERLHFHFSLSCIGEANGNPLQCSCLENPRDRGAWWAAISGVSQSWTQMKGLSSSSKSSSSRQENEWGGYRFVIGQSCWWEGEGNIPFKKWYFKNYLTTIICWAYTMYQTLRYWHKQIKTVKSICT